MAREKPAKAAADDTPADGEDTRKRLTMFVDTKTGALDARTRTETLESIKRMLAADGTRTVLGGSVDVALTSAKAGAGMDTSAIAMLYLALGKAEAVIAKMSGVPADRAMLLEFSDGEIERLLEPTKRVLDKYDVSFGKYEDELALAGTLIPIVLMKVQAMRSPTPPLTQSQEGKP